MKKVWFILAVLMCILASCSDGGSETPVTPNQKPGTSASEITIDSTILSGGLAFEASQGEKSITFSASSDWSLSIAETRSGTVWCTASPTSGGKGTASVKFTTAENTEPDDRSVAVTIKAGTASKTFTITQKGKDALLVTSKKYEVPQEGGEIEIEVKANVDYQMEVSESAKEWITEASGRALTTHKHIMKVASSEEAVKREGEIIFKSGDIVETVKVYQAGGPILLLSKNEFIVSDAGETISVDVKSNIEYSVQMPNVDWIKEQEAGRAMSSHTLKYIITPNTETDSRSASIVFFDKNSSLSDSLIITQKSKLNIILSDKYLKTSPVGTVVWVKLNDKLGMCDVEVSPQDDWINLHSWSLYEAEISIDYNNRINESRIGKVIFRNLALQVTDTLTIEQAAPGGFLHSYLENQYGKYFLGVDSLKIDFPIGGVDNRWLRQMMGGSEFYKPDWGRLEKLDLSAATIVTRKDKSQYKESDGTLKNATFGTTENIVSGYSNSNKLKCVYLPNNAEAISYQAFRNCDNLEKVIIGSGINSIGDYAFEGCSKLKNIKIPDNVVSLGKYAFQYCSLENVLLGNKIDSIGDYAFYDSGLKEINIPDNVVSIGESAFVRCWGMAVRLPQKLNIIKKSAFSGCSISELVFPDQLVTIGDEAFSNNDFNEISIPNSVVVIGRNAFSRCQLLKIVNLGNGITELADGIFSDCYELENISIPSSVKHIGKKAFENCKLTKVLIPNSVVTIDEGAFRDCKKLQDVQMGENVIEIKDGAFLNCYSLLEIRLADKVKDIGDRAFEGCKSLKKVVIGNVVEVISPSVFNNCEKLVNVVLGSNVKFIDSGAFRNTRIENMYINSQNPPKLHSLAFDTSWSSVQDSLRILYVPKGTLNAYKSSDWRYYFDGIKEMD